MTDYKGRWWRTVEDGEKILCELCPRACVMREGDRGFCFVRQNVGGEMVLTTYGKSTGFCIDPIEKKPLNHFLPGSSVLSFGTAGCNLGCRFCQNWEISKSREIEALSETASPDQIAQAAAQAGCRSVAFTYNDPVIWAEYAIDTARACHERGLKSVAVTAGYIMPEARREFYDVIDAANVDLKAFSELFYQHLALAQLEPVLDTLRWLKEETDVWFEITTLLIPTKNDSPDEIARMCDWLLNNVGDSVPLHFTAFHPDFRLQDIPATPASTLSRARHQALSAGLKYVYTGNVQDQAGQSTYCPQCNRCLIERNWYKLGQYHIKDGCCESCGHQIAGVYENQPGKWGARRVPVYFARD
jgi:pyruvate formate lyase activating enzyme